MGLAFQQGSHHMKYFILISTLVLNACSLIPSISISDTMSLIALTEENAPNGVRGTFKFQIKASGVKRGEVFLNTEVDYRDRRAITIALAPGVVSEFTHRYGASPDTYFVDKYIEVSGEAKRIRIDFISRGRMTNKYYYQTHINVTQLNQIRVLN